MPAFDLSARLAAITEVDPGAPALEYDRQWFTWGELRAAGDAVQALLYGAASSGARVGVVMRNRPGVVATMMSVVIARQALVTLSFLQPSGELAREVANLDLAAIVVPDQDWTRELIEAIRRSGAAGIAVPDHGLGGPRLVVAPTAAAADRVSPGVAVLMLTSGTTGSPKRVPIRDDALAEGFAGTRHYRPRRAEVRLSSGTSVIAIPLLHMGGLWGTLNSFLDGRRVAMLERFEVQAWAELVRENRPRAVNLPPTAIQMVLDAEIERDALASVKAVFAGTAPLPAELAERFEEVYGVPVLSVYGATEFGGGVAGWTLSDHRRYGAEKRGSVGRTHPGIDIRIVDPATGSHVGTGEVGLLELRGRQLRSDAPDGWVRTMDLASLDGDGFLWIRGRADDVIIRGGFKVSTSAVADVLRAHPDVGDAVVLGVAHERLGQVPVAAIEPASPGLPVDPEELRSFCRSRLTAYQVPARIVVVERLPRTPSMKVSGPRVRELLTSAG
jgi:acyl-CoA synthetase (AMP-forming)/AMP-acid ligase II